MNRLCALHRDQGRNLATSCPIEAIIPLRRSGSFRVDRAGSKQKQAIPTNNATRLLYLLFIRFPLSEALTSLRRLRDSHSLFLSSQILLKNKPGRLMPPSTGDTSSFGPVLMSVLIQESRPMNWRSLWGHLEFIVVVGNPNIQRQIVCRDFSAFLVRLK